MTSPELMVICIFFSLLHTNTVVAVATHPTAQNQCRASTTNIIVPLVMGTKVNSEVIALVKDLFFLAKIGETAKQVGLKIRFANSAEDLISWVQSKPRLIVLDLNADGIDPVITIKGLREAATSVDLPIVGFAQHEMTTLIDSALQAGCDQVLSRNAFTKHLPRILSGKP